MDSKYIQQFKKGAYEMILMSLISRKETYGYEILTELNANGGQFFGYAKEGTIYPILYRLERSGLIKSRIVIAKANGGSKKYYSLTDEGKKTLDELIEFWGSYKECIDNFVRNAK